MIVLSFWLREVCFDAFGIEFCSGSVPTARMRELRRNRLRALQLQRQIDRELQDASVGRQHERKRVYGAYLQQFSKVCMVQLQFSIVRSVVSFCLTE